MSFSEKNAWACMIALLVVYVPYFALSFLNPVKTGPLYLMTIVGMIVLLAVFHTANALLTLVFSGRVENDLVDEREKLIEIRSAKRAGLALSFIVTTWTFVSIIGLSGLMAATESSTLDSIEKLVIPALPVLISVQVLFAGFVFANVLYYASIVLGHRLG